MDVSHLPNLDPLSMVYSERFAVYNIYADENEKIFEWIHGKFDEKITSKLVNTELEDGNAILSVLGIGSGDGVVEIKMLMQLKKKFRRIECTVVEPSTERITSYQKLVEEQKDALSGVTFDWRQQTIKEFCKNNADGSKQFHFASAINSCYFIAKQELDFYLSTISEWTKGVILIVHGAENGCFSRLERKFKGSSHSPQGLTQENSITDSLRNLGISFETSVIPSECDVTSCFDSDSQDGKLLLDFLLQAVDCVDDGPPGLLKTIQEFLKSEGISYLRNGRLYVGVPTHATIAKSSKGGKA